MIVLNILIGLVGLGIVVFVHELGHLLAAKAVGIEVEAFSLGWGRKLWGFTWRGTEYRVSVFPVGGFCKMKGERSYIDALENDRNAIEHEEGSFFAASPWRRIVTLLAGPVANVILAILILSVVWWAGFSQETYQNRIVLASDFTPVAEPAPADRAGLETGDIITAIDGRDVRSYGDIQQIVAQNALTELQMAVERNGQRISLTITPELVPETGAGFVGVYPWVEPVVSQVSPGSAAAEAGFEVGDRVLSVNERSVAHVWEFRDIIEESNESVRVTVDRNGTRQSLTASADIAALSEGLAFETVLIPTPDYNVFQAIGRGTAESVRILTTSIRSLRLLFQGVQLRSAVAGPVRITYFIGDVATSGFQIDFSTGLRSLFNFLALLSVVLFFMNLLPIPVLDGGQIVLALVEWIRGRTPHPRALYRYQLVGSVLVFAILFFALFGDILFLAGR